MIPVGAIIAAIRFLMICIRQCVRSTEELATSDEQPSRNNDMVQEKSQVTITLPSIAPHQEGVCPPHTDAPPSYSLAPKDVSPPYSPPLKDVSPPRYVTVTNQPKL